MLAQRTLLHGSLLAALLLALAACGAPEEAVGTAQEANTVCAAGTTLEGVDVSHWNGTIDWAKAKAAGKVFGIAKATEHSTFVDNQFATNWAAMKQHGVVRGAYHFFHANEDPIAQADHFLGVLGTLEPGDLPPVLDLEVADGQSAATITSTAIAWLDYVAAATGTKPILYTGPSFVTGTMKSPAGLEDHADLWVAHWGVSCPNVPAPFTAWPFWQYDEKGVVPGISGDTDLDQFNGTLADLQAMTVQPPSSSSSSSSSSSTSSSSSSSTSSSSSSGGGAGGSTGGAGGATGTTTHTPGALGGGDGDGTGNTEVKGGCGCEVTGDEGGEGRAALLLVAIAALAARRRR